MLVVKRGPGECIVIGEGEGRVVVLVVETARGEVKLGVEAPSGTLVARGELAGAPRPVIRPRTAPRRVTRRRCARARAAPLGAAPARVLSRYAEAVA
jgi:carbon storage regulator CsrA